MTVKITQHEKSIFLAAMLFFIFICLPLAAQVEPALEFKKISKLRASTFGKGIASDGNRLFVTGSATANLFTHTFETYYVYIFQNNIWKTFNYPTKKFRKNISLVAEFLPAESKIITIGNPYQILNTKNLTMDFISVIGDYPISAGSAEWKNKIYLFGGYWTSSNYKNDVFTYNCSDRLVSFDLVTFTELAPIPNARSTKGKFINDKLYILGGDSLHVKYNDILEYDPENNHWQTKGYLPHTVFNYAITNDHQFIYLMGINDGKGFLGIYNTKTNGYREYVTNLDLMDGSLTLFDNKLYFFAGTFPGIRETNRNLYQYNLTMLPFKNEISCAGN